MDKIEKALHKLSIKEQGAVKKILKQILIKNFLGLEIKKLKGVNNLYRVRKGKLRIIFQQKKKTLLILAIERRTDKTYNKF